MHNARAVALTGRDSANSCLSEVLTDPFIAAVQTDKLADPSLRTTDANPTARLC